MYEEVFKALGEPTRLKIIRLLAEKELCVCDLEEIMDISQPRVSQHLKILKQAGLVKERKEGKKRICSFNREFFDWFMEEFSFFMHRPLHEVEEFAEEVKRMQNLDYDTCAIRRKSLSKKSRINGQEEK
ncbi:transcriptional regulator, ArsR family [Thermosyntropha lipolytica DSM 11003]|uniref:Transcriptional regulator, ArsR family n=1 Tax=Thermosyntropha lipolytica DSM 11003 TaxID=1123382 RepID=A0A1M5RIW7_9FIRM|nr:metalloregulator ArsR/SmtB family transcription factor [Thermosyntropha lipolytica]SHH26038.1 transcriptional regulator, ArsR family [Thermosyntropha lipolytica DSM 11003]